jgi:quercetin dioxygenase-like cupin family protein
MKWKWVCALLVATLGAGVYAGDVMATPSSGVTTTVLARSVAGSLQVSGQQVSPQWRALVKTDGTTDLYVVDNKFAAGSSSGWHTHPGPSLILVASGQVTNYFGNDPTCTGQTYRAGQSFIDPGGATIHDVRNETGEPAETIAVQLLPKDAPRKIDEPAPGNCPF